MMIQRRDEKEESTAATASTKQTDESRRVSMRPSSRVPADSYLISKIQKIIGKKSIEKILQDLYPLR